MTTIRQVEQAGASANLTRRGRIVARLVPTVAAAQGVPPWLRLRNTGVLRATPGESVLDAADFEADGNIRRARGTAVEGMKQVQVRQHRVFPQAMVIV